MELMCRCLQPTRVWQVVTAQRPRKLRMNTTLWPGSVHRREAQNLQWKPQARATLRAVHTSLLSKVAHKAGSRTHPLRMRQQLRHAGAPITRCLVLCCRLAVPPRVLVPHCHLSMQHGWRIPGQACCHRVHLVVRLGDSKRGVGVAGERMELHCACPLLVCDAPARKRGGGGGVTRPAREREGFVGVAELQQVQLDSGINVAGALVAISCLSPHAACLFGLCPLQCGPSLLVVCDDLYMRHA